MRISDWSSDVCSSDLAAPEAETRRGSEKTGTQCPRRIPVRPVAGQPGRRLRLGRWLFRNAIWSARMLRLERIRCSTQLGRKGTASSGIDACCRSEEHTSELQSLMRISYAVFCLKKKITICIEERKHILK